MKRNICIAAGAVSALLGTIGICLPLLPTVPLYLLAALCFARGSKRVHGWFVSTRLYQEHMKDYAQGKGLYMKVKLRIMLVITLQLAVGYRLMGRTPVGRRLLLIVWAGLMLFFLFVIRTRKAHADETHAHMERSGKSYAQG